MLPTRQSTSPCPSHHWVNLGRLHLSDCGIKRFSSILQMSLCDSIITYSVSVTPASLRDRYALMLNLASNSGLFQGAELSSHALLQERLFCLRRTRSYSACFFSSQCITVTGSLASWPPGLLLPRLGKRGASCIQVDTSLTQQH